MKAQKGFLQLDEIRLACRGMEATVGKTADGLSSQLQESVTHFEIRREAATGQFARGNSHDALSRGNQLAFGIFHSHEKLSNMLEILKSGLLQGWKANQKVYLRKDR